MALSPPLDQRNIRAEAKGKAYHFGEVYRGLGVRYLRRINRGQDSPATGLFRLTSRPHRGLWRLSPQRDSQRCASDAVPFRANAYFCIREIARLAKPPISRKRYIELY